MCSNHPLQIFLGQRYVMGGTNESFKKISTVSGASYAVHFVSVLNSTQPVINKPVESVLQVIDEEVLPGKNCVDSSHQLFS